MGLRRSFCGYALESLSFKNFRASYPSALGLCSQTYLVEDVTAFQPLVHTAQLRRCEAVPVKYQQGVTVRTFTSAGSLASSDVIAENFDHPPDQSMRRSSVHLYVDLKHKHVTDQELLGGLLLREIKPLLQGSLTQKISLDLSYNLLSEVGLRHLVHFLEENEAVVRCSVAHNSFTEEQLHRTAFNMRHMEWLQTGRIHIGGSIVDTLQKLDTTESSYDKQISDVAGYLGNQQECYEQVIFDVLVEYLIEELGCEDLSTGCHLELPAHTGADGEVVAGVDWHGVVSCTKSGVAYVFLLDAKQTSTTQDMLTLEDRVMRTHSFIAQSSKGVADEVYDAHKKLRKTDLGRRKAWAAYANHQVRAVLAADEIPEAAKAMCKRRGFITIQVGKSGFSFSPPNAALFS